ncbi:hypothetical protein E2986_13226 [Frieseomelitta varia]|uniref:Uncharacterized protein n=1 Tax=Frieseomelitta varia TaxID=561572 RepID=A0A833SBW9_9HYME|nr:hypothetical protein E2986_13226 [Frieseomelitta varia]
MSSIEEVADYPEFHRNDFSIVVSPVFKHAKIPFTEDGYIDLSYLSADCFHLSQKSNARCIMHKYNVR